MMPKKQDLVQGSEARLQQKCFTWHWNTRLRERRMLYMIYNNPPNAIAGSWLKGMGMIKGAADLVFMRLVVRPDGVFFKVFWLECKLERGVQSEVQKEFEQKARAIGMEYFLFRSEAEFQQIFYEIDKRYGSL